MSFTKNDLETIKSKLKLSGEIEKKTKIIKKGNDYWCCCPFHEEKTPSCKINDDLGSYYCFGCGAKGDIFTIYTDLYNFSFPDAVRELAQKAGLQISQNNFRQDKENEIIFKILELSTSWFENNLSKSDICKKYLKNRSLSNSTIKNFKIGYSYNPESSLYKFLKDRNFKDEDILKANVVKKDSNNKIRDFFYKRLIFPISNEQNKVVGFGGRVLDNSNPKYINSPDSFFFKKRSILYNLGNAKKNIRSKNNILICEGYMDVISLYENNVRTAVAPLGTSLTEDQLLLSWKYVKKPTLMFDGDNAGVRASYKSALMALPYLSPNKFLQFITLPKDTDPDSYINDFSLKKFIEILKKPIPIVNFIFEQSSSTINLNNADNKISYDKYIDDLVENIKDKKIQYFYRSEFKKLFFEKIKINNRKSGFIAKPSKIEPLIDKQINSFLLAYVNHLSIREKLFELFKNVDLFNQQQADFIEYFQKSEIKNLTSEEIFNQNLPTEILNVFNKINQNSLLQLFPYSKKDYVPEETMVEIEESIKNLNTRLSNLKKINKSLDKLQENFSSLSWEELKNFSADLHNSED